MTNNDTILDRDKVKAALDARAAHLASPSWESNEAHEHAVDDLNALEVAAYELALRDDPAVLAALDARKEYHLHPSAPSNRAHYDAVARLDDAQLEDYLDRVKVLDGGK
jgi:FMN phosphatase YigB (HAD superfamily)